MEVDELRKPKRTGAPVVILRIGPLENEREEASELRETRCVVCCPGADFNKGWKEVEEQPR
jgi:hypothetical protein